MRERQAETPDCQLAKDRRPSASGEQTEGYLGLKAVTVPEAGCGSRSTPTKSALSTKCFEGQPPLTPQAITALRQRLRKTQAQFAELLSVDTVTISRWETGKRKPRAIYEKELLRLREEGGDDQS
jgi:DNA-binding transcriptional regulator YiaG